RTCRPHGRWRLPDHDHREPPAHPTHPNQTQLAPTIDATEAMPKRDGGCADRKCAVYVEREVPRPPMVAQASNSVGDIGFHNLAAFFRWSAPACWQVGPGRLRARTKTSKERGAVLSCARSRVRPARGAWGMGMAGR